MKEEAGALECSWSRIAGFNMMKGGNNFSRVTVPNSITFVDQATWYAQRLVLDMVVKKRWNAEYTGAAFL